MSLIQKLKNTKKEVVLANFTTILKNYFLKIEPDMRALARLKEIAPEDAKVIADRINSLTLKTKKKIRRVNLPPEYTDFILDIEETLVHMKAAMDLVPVLLEGVTEGRVNFVLMKEYRDHMIEVNKLIRSAHIKIQELTSDKNPMIT